MEKFEYNVVLDQIKTLFAEENYEAAAELADTLNWSKVRNVNALVKVGEVYEKVGRYEDSCETYLMAFDRSPIGRMIVYRLAEVYIKMKNFEEAQKWYDEFVQLAPQDHLRYVIRYRLLKAQGAQYSELIPILEEYKEQDYIEEWAYELAYLYHRSGLVDKCIEACDELILWFGDGPYVERALELKMLYQPLTKIQEEKYRSFRMAKDGITHIGVEEMRRAGEYEHAPVSIPQVAVNPEKFNTVNLQEEIAKGMQQIMDAKEKSEVADSLESINKIVEEIPYLKIPRAEEGEEEVHIETDEEIDGSLRINFQELLGEEYDGQMSLVMNERAQLEHQITGQMTIAEVLEEWEKTKRAAEAALQEAEQRKLESAKARALQQAEDIMDRLTDVLPQLQSGVTPQELLAQEYMQGADVEGELSVDAQVEEVVEVPVAGVMEEVFPVEEEVPAAVEVETPLQELFAKPEFKIPIPSVIPAPIPVEVPTPEIEVVTGAEILANTKEFKIEGAYEVTPGPDPEEGLEEELLLEEDVLPHDYEEVEIPEIGIDQIPTIEEPIMEEEEFETEEISENEEVLEAEEVLESEETLEAEEALESEEILEAEEALENEEELPEIALPEDILSEEIVSEEVVSEEETALEEALDEVEEAVESVEEDLGSTRRMPEIIEPEDLEEEPVSEEPVKVKPHHLTKEQKAIFSYFVPVKGMEDQLCNVVAHTAHHLNRREKASVGNIIIQGGQGSGKTTLATSIIKVLQRETGKITGRVGKIDGEALNTKDVNGLLRKVTGGCLIIERAGGISRSTAVTLSLLLEQDCSGVLVILEDTSMGIKQALSLDEKFANMFSQKVTVPIFTIDELVAFARSYANELGYEIEELAVLALYQRISNMERLDQATTLTEVKEVVDQAIYREAHGGLKKAWSIVTAERYTDDDKIVLREKDFDVIKG